MASNCPYRPSLTKRVNSYSPYRRISAPAGGISGGRAKRPPRNRLDRQYREPQRQSRELRRANRRGASAVSPVSGRAGRRKVISSSSGHRPRRSASVLDAGEMSWRRRAWRDLASPHESSQAQSAIAYQCGRAAAGHHASTPAEPVVANVAVDAAPKPAPLTSSSRGREAKRIDDNAAARCVIAIGLGAHQTAAAGPSPRRPGHWRRETNHRIGAT